MREGFVQEHLARVSRSFALAIRLLEEPLCAWIGTSYLLFRVLDTVEDARELSVERRLKLFDCFDEAVANPTNIEAVSAIKTLASNPSLSGGEKALVQEFDQLLHLFQEMDSQIRKEIVLTLNIMSKGMRDFVTEEGLRLRDLEEVDRYCYFVAGCIGELLTRLLQNNRNLNLTGLLPNAVHFGLFLQKINILKDQVEDEALGRQLVPTRTGIRKSLKIHSDKALEYLLEVRTISKSYAMFCGISLFLGLASIPYIETSFKVRSLKKIPREMAISLLSQLQSVMDSKDDLIKLYGSFIAPLSAPESGS